MSPLQTQGDSVSINGSSNIPKIQDLSNAFPEATPASTFPPPVSDYYHVLDDLLAPEDKSLQKKVRAVMEKDVAPIMAQYWEKAEFPFHIIPKLASLNISGGIIKGYGCPGLSISGLIAVIIEMTRVDASISTFFFVHTLAMQAIGILGSEEQKQKYLPSLARLDHVASFAATEPNHGSDVVLMSTTATKVPGGWLLSGQKRWIGNSTFADILIILARNKDTKQVNGFIVKKGAPGLKVTKIENKISLRMVQNGDIVLEKVFVPDEDRLSNFNSYLDINEVLSLARFAAAWQAVGLSMGVYDACHRYLKERKQFGVPLSAFQLNQEKLVRMLGNIQAMQLMGWKLTKLYESGKMTIGQSSLGKAWVTAKARETASLGRELLGGNGILTDFLVGKAFCDIEPVHTYEGTYELNSLVTGREITGIASIKAGITASQSRL